MAGRFGFSTDSFSTSPHELHKIRRKALSPFFAASKIVEFESVIKTKVDDLCRKLAASADGEVVKLDRAFVALTTDTITQYAFGESYDHLDSPGFEKTLYEAFRTIQSVGALGQQFPSVFKILNALPLWFVKATQPEIMPIVTLRQSMRARIAEIRAGSNDTATKIDHANIFYEVIHSDLPDSEKTDTRLGDEAQLMVAAGLITTSWALAVATFHFARSRQCLGINLALAELHIAIAQVFARFDFELFETEESDVRMAHAWLAPYPKLDSKGVRAKVREYSI
ncbi:hypothetical protein KNSL1_011176 [Colletotrichum chrysophilum]|nr:hypothetical protein KNSL1_011176 [Colletotrichum chrysophilum]